ncbi:MAG TPA: pantoate--beta-alanine ligase [Bacteroidales bacterium]|nr:MAG: pantoate--beta-alanine ligase [Bacteroidetes bacterium GWF2_33_38]OFY72951.1 MAG: pantoate--beta-alanine ligase [Bacteroidetes bacterium RIFOXYA12_FULL_33_9]OFY92314.1 MAG: pantoate--beta-alanine ligase [Bacteroidetes bacterium RIFOXYA2_FULL_33_7]HBF87171.1 pantoate--beta-alanine ligase [Bacteroidales bacterium]
MKIFSTTAELQTELSFLKAKKLKLGFVPTMGALHKGHISLIEESKKHSDITIVSIFVNPTQFNNSDDYKKYPRTIDSDTIMLDKAGVDILFCPSEKEIYNNTTTNNFDFGLLETVMEGQFRPGHFKGVAQIVSILFDIVTPDLAFFGEKDFQQLAVIKKLVKDYNYHIIIKACPTIRESDGLAMSSRNVRLQPDERIQVANISRILFLSKEYLKNHSVTETINWATNHLNSFNKMKVEYLNIINEDTFEDISEIIHSQNIRACIAVFVGEVRLIDNIRYIY